MGSPMCMPQWQVALQMDYFPVLFSEGSASTGISKDAATGMILTVNCITF